MPRQKLFSVSLKDCEVQTFRSSGKGGQNVNKVESGVRIIHPPSGAVGRAIDTRDQLKNKRLAFRRMAESPAFRAWVKLKAAELSTGKTLEERVDEELHPSKLRVEVRGPQGWTAYPSE